MTTRTPEQEAAIDAAIEHLDALLIARRNQKLSGKCVRTYCRGGDGCLRPENCGTFAPVIRSAVVDAAMEMIAEQVTYTGRLGQAVSS